MRTKTEHTNQCSAETDCANCLNTVGIVGLTGNILLALLKVFVGLMFFSTALLADALYSILDIGFSILIIVGLKISTKPPDHNHDYGHGKVEFVITIVFSVLTVIGAIVLFVFALFELHEGVPGTFSALVLITAIISIVANLTFARFTDCIATRFFSPSIRSLSMHSKADAVSSVLVTISMIFAYWGYNNIGPFVAIIETAHLLLIGSEIFKDSLYGLLDAAISPQEIKDIKTTLSSIDGVKNINYVRSRKIGQKVWLNVEIEIPPSFSVGMVDTIKDNINEMLKDRIKNLEKIMINIVPYREEREVNNCQLLVRRSHPERLF